MSKDEREEEKRAFKVTDRRRFAGEAADSPAASEKDEGEERVDEPAGESESPSKSSSELEPGAASGKQIPQELTFSAFIMGLSTQVLMSLGEVSNPVDGEKKQDLRAAKELIDLLAILRDKTAGNLDGNEQQLLDGMLYDLRLRYVEVARGR